MKQKFKLSKDWLIINYIDSENSLDQLASSVGCSRETVRRALIRFNLPTKPRYRGLTSTTKNYKKGLIPWNKGIKYSDEAKGRLNIKGLEKGRGYFKGQIIKLNYANIHYWVRKQKKYPDRCSDCGKTTTQLEWSNVDHKYSLILSDYIARCKKCHILYDKQLKHAMV